LIGTDKRREQLAQAQVTGGVFNDHDLERGKEKAVVITDEGLTATKEAREAKEDEQSATSKPVYAEARPVSKPDIIGDDTWFSVRKPGSGDSPPEDSTTGTVGAVCMYMGHIAAATSTGGLTNKRAGRIGDTPIVGAGNYANDATCAVSATGKGEDFLRHVAAYDVSSRIAYGEMSLHDAVHSVVFEKLPPECGGMIAINAEGEYVMEFSSLGMFRGVCDSSGKGVVGIWEELIPVNLSP
jgi:beta-aspartyl-peptidase (threonine type)